MKAVVCARYGPPEVLLLGERATPIPRKNEVRIRIRATAVTSSDCCDYTREDFTDRATRYDLVFDAVGKRKSAAALRRSRQVLAPRGACVSVDDGRPALRRQDLVLLGELAMKGEVKPVNDRTYALESIVEAHRYVDGGHKQGNVVVAVA